MTNIDQQEQIGEQVAETETAIETKTQAVDRTFTQDEVDAIIKLTDVDGVYNKDPKKHADAELQKTCDFDYCITNVLVAYFEKM